jgi:ABC-type transport system substrate-binding protein
MERNPNFRELRYDAAPAPGDVEGEALLRRFKGRRLPMIDRVEISIVEESQPRWLSFLSGDFDLVSVPLEFANQAVPGGHLAPYLAKRGVTMDRYASADRTLYYFNMEDPVVGGMTPEKVALRRAISLATDVQREISGIRRGQAIPAQSIVAPGGYGYDPSYRSENSVYDVARAKALLDMYGYVDRDGDGWRELPDGRPLVIEYASTPDALSRQFDELWKKNLDAIGVRLRIKAAQWPEQLKAARAGQLMVWQLGYTASSPDVQDGLQILYGPAAGGQNLSRFKDARFDEIYRRLQSLPDGPERLELLREALRIVTAYAPQKYNVHRIVTYLMQPWLQGFRAPMYGNQFWQWVDIEDVGHVARR